VTGDHRYIISSGRPENQTVIFDLNHLPGGALNWRDFICGMDQAASRRALAPARRASLAPEPVCRNAVIAVETDWEFTAETFGGDADAAAAYVLMLLGAVSEIFDEGVDTELEVGFLRLWADPDDPWTQTHISAQLNEFENYWNNNMQKIQRHAVHFLTPRHLAGAGGLAELPGLCIEGSDYAISAYLNGFFPYPLEDHHPQNWDVYVVAHEIGHNVGAIHTHFMNPPVDQCAIGDCDNADQGTIMSYCNTCPGGMENINLHFHPRTIDEYIEDYLEHEAPCDIVVPCCPGNLNEDVTVDASDLFILLAAWGPNPADPADINGDGVVNVIDLIILLSNWGAC
jgi:hypothetical protein